MIKPFFSRKYEPMSIGEDNSWIFWRWYDIINEDMLYLRRLYIIRTPWFSIMLHRILGPDPDRHLHDHPWNFISFVLRGWYTEVRPGHMEPEAFRRRWFNFCRAEGAHRITYVSSTCTTLVLTGRKTRAWGFHTDKGWMGWKEYIYG